MGSKVRKMSGLESLKKRKQKLRDLNMTETEISNFLIREMGPRNAAENLNDFWRNWREGKGGNDMYKIGDGKRKIDFIDNLILSEEFRKKMSDQNILVDMEELPGVTITDEPNPPTMKINPTDIDPSDPIGRRGKPSQPKVKVKKAEKVIPGVQGETSPEEERDFQKGVSGEDDAVRRSKAEEARTRKNAEPVTEMPTAGAASVLSTTPDTDSYPPMGISKQKVVESKGDVSFTGVDQIPESRLNTDNKSQEELRADIRYFFSNFPKPLMNLKSKAKNLNKMGLISLQRLHKRIVNILQPNKIQMRGKKVGVVIDAEEYIKQKVGEVMISNAIKGYEIPNLQPLTTENKNENEEEDVKDIGSYEVKRGPDGGLNAQKEPVYRFIPTTNEEELDEIAYDYESKRKPKRMKLPKTKMRNQVVTGKRQVASNPFLKKQGGHRLNVLL